VLRTGLTVLARLVQPLGCIGRRRPTPARYGPPQRPQMTHRAPTHGDEGEPFNDDLPF
jgi:hypothetical protein